MIVLAIVLLLFGSTRLPQLARSLGQARNEFKRAEREDAPDATTAESA
jgi:TatA/E family protein of Tat protein translocase